MKSFRVVLHFEMSTRCFDQFCPPGSVPVDAIYKAVHGSHRYYQDYSQIIIDFGIASYEQLARKVLFVSASDHDDPECELSNPDLQSTCRRVPVIYAAAGIARKYKAKFACDPATCSHYEPVTLLLPSVRSQRGFSMLGLVKMAYLLALAPEFQKGIGGEGLARDTAISIRGRTISIKLQQQATEEERTFVPKTESADFIEGAKSVANRPEFRGMFRTVETGTIWESFSLQKSRKRTLISHIHRLAQTQQKRTASLPKREASAESGGCAWAGMIKDQNVAAAYVNLLAMNSRQAEAPDRKLDLRAEFSDEEYDGQVKEMNADSRVSELLVPSAGFFEASSAECIRTEPAPFYQRWACEVSLRQCNAMAVRDPDLKP